MTEKEQAEYLIELHSCLGGDLINWALTYTDVILRNPEIGDKKRKFWKGVQSELYSKKQQDILLKQSK